MNSSEKRSNRSHTTFSSKKSDKINANQDYYKEYISNRKLRLEKSLENLKVLEFQRDQNNELQVLQEEDKKQQDKLLQKEKSVDTLLQQQLSNNPSSQRLLAQNNSYKPLPELDMSPLKKNKILMNKSAEKVKKLLNKTKNKLGNNSAQSTFLSSTKSSINQQYYGKKFKTKVSRNPLNNFDKNLFQDNDKNVSKYKLIEEKVQKQKDFIMKQQLQKQPLFSSSAISLLNQKKKFEFLEKNFQNNQESNILQQLNLNNQLSYQQQENLNDDGIIQQQQQQQSVLPIINNQYSQMVHSGNNIQNINKQQYSRNISYSVQQSNNQQKLSKEDLFFQNLEGRIQQRYKQFQRQIEFLQKQELFERCNEKDLIEKINIIHQKELNEVKNEINNLYVQRDFLPQRFDIQLSPLKKKKVKQNKKKSQDQDINSSIVKENMVIQEQESDIFDENSGCSKQIFLTDNLSPIRKKKQKENNRYSRLRSSTNNNSGTYRNIQDLLQDEKTINNVYKSSSLYNVTLQQELLQQQRSFQRGCSGSENNVTNNQSIISSTIDEQNFIQRNYNNVKKQNKSWQFQQQKYSSNNNSGQDSSFQQYSREKEYYQRLRKEVFGINRLYKIQNEKEIKEKEKEKLEQLKKQELEFPKILVNYIKNNNQNNQSSLNSSKKEMEQVYLKQMQKYIEFCIQRHSKNNQILLNTTFVKQRMEQMDQDLAKECQKKSRGNQQQQQQSPLLPQLNQLGPQSINITQQQQTIE